ncbi:MAG TPA: NAD(P)H-binding protein [Candidatus Thermoplasmatota archaeon]|nr:NAD(P)H-binding protein [Candidatus Thermoplasmatota archaeon]
MKVAVTGGTGYVGPAVVKEMLADGHEVVVLEHRRPVPIPDHPRLRRVKGDVRDRASLERAFAGCDAVAHLVAILREAPRRGVTFQSVHVEGTRNVIEAAKAAGARRLLLMTANDVERRDTPYFETKWRMEEMAKASGLDWTIFRPSFVSGTREPGGDGKAASRGTDESFDETFAGIVDKAPVLPSFGGGRFEIQPVSRRNVAQAFARALSRPQTVAKTYVLVGPERMTWNEYLRRLARLRGKRRPLVWTPTPVVRAAASAVPGFPATSDQLKMLVHGSVGDPGPAVRDLDLKLEAWEDAVAGLRRAR